MDKPRQQHERRAATVELIRSLENPARSASRNPEERAQLIRLIKEEQAVQQWADNAGAKSSNDQYRANMAVAKSNSQQVEATLRSALRLFKAGDLQEAAAQLHTVSTKGSTSGHAQGEPQQEVHGIPGVHRHRIPRLAPQARP